jgi:hypothetical protein
MEGLENAVSINSIPMQAESTKVNSRVRKLCTISQNISVLDFAMKIKNEIYKTNMNFVKYD